MKNRLVRRVVAAANSPYGASDPADLARAGLVALGLRCRTCRVGFVNRRNHQFITLADDLPGRTSTRALSGFLVWCILIGKAKGSDGMELPLIFLTAFVVGFSGAMMPGPLLVVTVGETARRGWSAGPRLVSGHALLELVLVVLLVGGLRSFLTQPVLAAGIGLVGGLALAGMGYTMFRSAYRGEVSLESLKVAEGAGVASDGRSGAQPDVGLPSGRSSLAPALAGALASLSNPYWLLWWATVGAGYVVVALEKGGPGVASFYLGHISSDFLWYSLVALGVAAGRRFLSARVYRGILMACGAFLILLSLHFLRVGVGLLA